MRGKLWSIKTTGQVQSQDIAGPPSLETLTDIVGGLIETIPYFDFYFVDGEKHRCVAFCNEQDRRLAAQHEGHHGLGQEPDLGQTHHRCSSDDRRSRRGRGRDYRRRGIIIQLMTIGILYLAFHIVCGILAYGLTYAYFARKYVLVDQFYTADVTIAFISALGGPLGILLFVLTLNENDHFRGVQFRPFQKQAIIALNSHDLVFCGQPSDELAAWLNENGIKAYFGYKGHMSAIVFEHVKDAIVFKFCFHEKIA